MMTNEFKTQVDLDVFLSDDQKAALGLNEHGDNYNVDTATTNIRWNLELELRNYGIKGFYVTVPAQTITLFVTVWGDDEDIEKELTVEIKGVEVEVENDGFPTVPHTLSMSDGDFTLHF
jgi:phage-related protein